MTTQVRPRRDIDLPSLLAYAYTPILPYLRQIRIPRRGPRTYDPADILVPDGYTVEVVATGFSEPVHCTFDDQGFCYVVECGHKVEARPRILKVDPRTGVHETFFELPAERWVKTGAVTGACWHAGSLYLTNTDTVSRLGPDGRLEDIVTELPGRGDHQTNHPLVGPDGKLYFGQGSVTNLGVVGADNAAYEWLPRFSAVCDVPASAITLAGRNYEFRNVLGDVRERVRTGAFVPFGTETRAGQVIEGNVKCSGAILRCNLDGSELEVVAWGLRNPYGIAFHPDGRLFATEHGSDERGGRYIVGDPDDFYEIREGAWYGWPDFASGIRLDDPHWGDGGQGRAPVLAEFPDPNPPKPVAAFEPHGGANGFDFSRSTAFGFEGQAFVALFGDVAPVTTARQTTPAGFKVVRADPSTGRVVDFAVNRIAGPASKLPHAGFERPAHCQFGPDGALYVLDFGELELAPEAGGIRAQAGTGALWRIRRISSSASEAPPQPLVIPLYALQALVLAVGTVALALGLGWLLRRLFFNGRR
jgi:glucose/arabinose dehydrogenase